MLFDILILALERIQARTHAYIHTHNASLLIAYCMPDSVLAAGDKKDKIARTYSGKQAGNK